MFITTACVLRESTVRQPHTCLYAASRRAPARQEEVRGNPEKNRSKPVFSRRRGADRSGAFLDHRHVRRAFPAAQQPAADGHPDLAAVCVWSGRPDPAGRRHRRHGSGPTLAPQPPVRAGRDGSGGPGETAATKTSQCRKRLSADESLHNAPAQDEFAPEEPAKDQPATVRQGEQQPAAESPRQSAPTQPVSTAPPPNISPPRSSRPDETAQNGRLASGGRVRRVHMTHRARVRPVPDPRWGSMTKPPRITRDTVPGWRCSSGTERLSNPTSACPAFFSACPKRQTGSGCENR